MADTESRLHTHPSLLLRLRDLADGEAWQLFADIYAPLVFRYCKKQGLQDADTSDVTQDVLAQVARSIRTFDYQPERGRFRDWLGAVVRSKLVRFHQKASRREAAAPADEAVPLLDDLTAAADAEWAAQFNAHLVRVALERIRPAFDAHNWRAFELVWVENLPATEVAGTTGLTASAVYVAKSRILKRLREEILILAEDIPHLVPLGDNHNGR
jgi:RNA polymerase sigma-70 factor (ECF subfamily)